MVSVIEQGGAWFAVYHYGDHVRSDLTNVISSYMFHDITCTEVFAAGMRLWGNTEAEAEK